MDEAVLRARFAKHTYLHSGSYSCPRSYSCPQLNEVKGLTCIQTTFTKEKSQPNWDFAMEGTYEGKVS